MAVAGSQKSVSTATLLSTAPTDLVSGSSVVATNRHATVSVSVYLGPSGVTSTGYELKAGESVAMDLNPGEALYAIAASGQATARGSSHGLSVTVITASLPERAVLLGQALASVAAQSYQPAAHLVGIDYDRIGPEAIRNALVAAADTEWVAFLDDDDLLYPHHLAALLSASDGADVVYPFCDVTGRGDWTPNETFDPDTLRTYNFIPITTLVRRATFLAVGGFRKHPLEDWNLWVRMLDHGARFVCVPEVTWRYRFHACNATYANDSARPRALIEEAQCRL